MKAAASVLGVGAVCASAYYWPVLVDEPASIRNYTISAAAPKLRPTAWALIQTAFKEQIAALGPVEFGDASELRRSTNVRYGYISREIFENATAKNTFKLRSVDDSFHFEFPVRNKNKEDIGTVHGEFKLSGENVRNGSAAFRFHGNNVKGRSATVYEVKDPLEPLQKQFEYAVYSSKEEERFGPLVETYGFSYMIHTAWFPAVSQL